MKEIQEFLNSLSVKEMVFTYEKEYLPFKKTGVLPDGNIRYIARLFNKISGDMNVRFAESLFLAHLAEAFYNQNK